MRTTGPQSRSAAVGAAASAYHVPGQDGTDGFNFVIVVCRNCGATGRVLMSRTGSAAGRSSRSTGQAAPQPMEHATCRLVFVVVAAMNGMTAAVVQVVNVITVWYRDVSAALAVDMVVANMCGVPSGGFTFVEMTIVGAVDVSIMQVVDASIREPGNPLIKPLRNSPSDATSRSTASIAACRITAPERLGLCARKIRYPKPG